MSQHTPGPWTVSSICPLKVEREVPGLADGHESYIVAESKVHSLIGQDEAASNARLIAAAPDLLAVLQMAVKNNMLVEGSEWWGDVFCAIKKAISQ